MALYIPVSRDFTLLPCFGALLNPFAGLVRTLRRQYRLDWDRAVGRREAVFLQELKAIFHAPRFLVTTGPTLRRGDGTALTDIDAIVLDREFGTIALLQLKWHDVFGRSLRERHSRRLNLLKANEWVARVSEWLNELPTDELITRLGLRGISAARRTMLFVVSRYAAQFSENDVYDDRSAWLSWADLITSAPSNRTGDVLAELEQRFRGGLRFPHTERVTSVQHFDLPGLRVDVRVV